MSIVLDVKSLTFSYQSRLILNNLSFNVKEGEHFSVLGPNGSGKTTLLKLLTRSLKPERGKIKLFEKDIEVFKDWHLVGYVPQTIAIESLLCASVYELLKASGKHFKEQVEFLHLENILNRPFKSLSGGERQRVLIAMALSTRPSLLILDEPTNGLDPHARGHIIELLQSIDKTLILVSHDIELVLSLANRMLCLPSGEVLTPPEFLLIKRQLYGFH
ncbi:MAG: metal ABC transporter ATP-binding protein [Aquificaceae bacterium]|nr:metal ABC transporter ATP-binding protein [Aquificaceae bacterium]MDW8237397.1 metal ABC transporter ATP-binding protein [Aquificaceae bacterium]